MNSNYVLISYFLLLGLPCESTVQERAKNTNSYASKKNLFFFSLVNL